MLLGLALIGGARSTKEGGEARFSGRAKIGMLSGGGLSLVIGLLLCIGRMIQWKQAVGDL